MLWYFQKPGDTALTLIGYLNYGAPNFEGSNKEHFSFTGDLSSDKAKNASFVIKNLSVNSHSAVYYCAASYAQCYRSRLFSTKTLRVKHLNLRYELNPATSYQHIRITSLPVPAQTPGSDAKSSVGLQGSALIVTMIRLLIIFFVPLFWITGVSLSQEVIQTPSTLLGKPEDKIQLSCRHNIPNYDTILWYQRSVGDTALKLIAYVSYKSPIVESPHQDIFDVSGDGEKEAHLHLLKLRQPEDDGQYFCAAYMTQWWSYSSTSPPAPDWG
ncbi:uncharacterized protein LOC124484739 [Hypomesus transpacificus]|uniref:uncharacterized protein LOC124484739 n=1 Tax=Hypomesus transpacificus TaxID=137520 RepID=UPI001F0844CF|nr:uncharacterized protein LOC124484739 [Hypomesus transpacificus]